MCARVREREQRSNQRKTPGTNALGSFSKFRFRSSIAAFFSMRWRCSFATSSSILTISSGSVTRRSPCLMSSYAEELTSCVVDENVCTCIGQRLYVCTNAQTYQKYTPTSTLLHLHAVSKHVNKRLNVLDIRIHAIHPNPARLSSAVASFRHTFSCHVTPALRSRWRRWLYVRMALSPVPQLALLTFVCSTDGTTARRRQRHRGR